MGPILSPSWAHLGPVLGPSWGHVGPSWALLGPSWAHLGPSWARLGPSWPLLGPSRADRGLILGHVGAPFGYLQKVKEIRSCPSGPSASSFNLKLCDRFPWDISFIRPFARNPRLGNFGHVPILLETLLSIMGYVVAGS